MLKQHSRSGLARFRAMRWPALVMLVLILVQSIGVAACVDHDVRADSASTNLLATAPDDASEGAGKQILHSSACSHCVCPHFVALPAASLLSVADFSAHGAVVGRSWLSSNAPIEEALRPPAVV